jgi:hypothetical protein
MSPFHLFTGSKIYYKKSLALLFVDYCEVFDGSNNTSKSHSLPCIALHPCDNSTRSWQFLNIMTGVIIRRSNWHCMVTMQAVINKVNIMLTVTPMQDVAVVPETKEKPNVEPVLEEQSTMESIVTEHTEEVDARQPSHEENTAQSNAQEAIVPVWKSA